MKQLWNGEVKMIMISNNKVCARAHALPLSQALIVEVKIRASSATRCSPKIIPHLKCTLPLRTHCTRTGCSTNWHAGCLCQMFTHLLTEIQRLLPISSSCSGCSYSRVSKNCTLDTFLLEPGVLPNRFGNKILLGVLFSQTRENNFQKMCPKSASTSSPVTLPWVSMLSAIDYLSHKQWYLHCR